MSTYLGPITYQSETKMEQKAKYPEKVLYKGTILEYGAASNHEYSSEDGSHYISADMVLDMPDKFTPIQDEPRPELDAIYQVLQDEEPLGKITTMADAESFLSQLQKLGFDVVQDFEEIEYPEGEKPDHSLNTLVEFANYALGNLNGYTKVTKVDFYNWRTDTFAQTTPFNPESIKETGRKLQEIGTETAKGIDELGEVYRIGIKEMYGAFSDFAGHNVDLKTILKANGIHPEPEQPETIKEAIEKIRKLSESYADTSILVKQSGECRKIAKAFALSANMIEAATMPEAVELQEVIAFTEDTIGLFGPCDTDERMRKILDMLKRVQMPQPKGELGEVIKKLQIIIEHHWAILHDDDSPKKSKKKSRPIHTFAVDVRNLLQSVKVGEGFSEKDMISFGEYVGELVGEGEGWDFEGWNDQWKEANK